MHGFTSSSNNSTLLPDEFHCKSQLGSMLYGANDARKKWGFHAEIIGTREPMSSLFGHVEYDVRITATPHNALELEPKHFELATRFKDMNRLYTQLTTIHRQLYLKDTFPAFAEAKLFAGSTPELIAERRHAIELMLNFVIRNEVLSKTRIFQTFIETSKEVPTASVAEPSSGKTAAALPIVTIGGGGGDVGEVEKTVTIQVRAPSTKRSNGGNGSGDGESATTMTTTTTTMTDPGSKCNLADLESSEGGKALQGDEYGDGGGAGTEVNEKDTTVVGTAVESEKKSSEVKEEK